MATSKAIRADDVSGLNIATIQATEDALTKDFQRVVLNDPTTPANMAAVDGSGNLKASVSGTVTANAGTGTLNVRQSDGTNPVTKTFDLDTGVGTEYNLGVGLRKAASGGSVEAGTASDPLRIDPTGTTAQPVTGTVTANIGPATSGGTSAYHAVAAASNNSASVKASAGQVYGWSIYNNAAYPVYVKLYNKATAPEPGTDSSLLVKVVGVQAGTHVSCFNACGIAGFSSGIGLVAVKGITDTDNTSLAASDCLIEIDFK